MVYDNAGNMLQQFDGKNNVTEVQYNVRGLPKTRIDGAGLAETYTYYANGAMHTKTDRNTVITTYTYDIFGRIASQAAGQESISYTYDDNGNQLTMTDSSGTTERTQSKGTVHLLDKHPGDNIYYPRGEKYAKTSTKKKQHRNISYSFERN